MLYSVFKNHCRTHLWRSGDICTYHRLFFIVIEMLQGGLSPVETAVSTMVQCVVAPVCDKALEWVVMSRIETNSASGPVHSRLRSQEPTSACS